MMTESMPSTASGPRSRRDATVVGSVVGCDDMGRAIFGSRRQVREELLDRSALEDPLRWLTGDGWEVVEVGAVVQKRE